MTTNLSPVNIKKFLSVHQSLLHVKYGLGSKAFPLSKAPSAISRIDCSGYARYMIYHAADRFQIPDGSWIQREWCEKNGLEQISYSAAVKEKNALSIAFATAGKNGVGKVGHVWFIHNGSTYESYSGEGVGSLPATNAWRAAHVHKAFIYPTTAEVVPAKPYLLRQSSGALMAELPVFSGRSFVPARSWGAWLGLPVHWDSAEQKIYLNAVEVRGEVKLIDNTAYVPFVEAAELAQVNYVVDNAAREIRLQPRGNHGG